MSFSFNIREQILVGVTAVVILTVIFGVFMFKPQYDRLSDAQSQQAEEKQTQETKKAEIASLKAAKDNAAATEAKSLALGKRMPEEADLPTVIVELDDLGKRHNVKVHDIAATTASPGSGYSYIPIDVKASGTYFNITDFLYGIVKLPREYSVGTADLEIAEAGYPILSANIKLYTFVYTPNATSTDAQSGTTPAQTSTAQPTQTEAK